LGRQQGQPEAENNEGGKSYFHRCKLPDFLRL
jgi:hypothetical protein